ncbi:hypothetical protein F3Y22_tig00005465pilonHSYRG00097 [Hibiscus syriacus]|uniref:Uncharacterized protein n=1 Tax=Hibiscus syriacus TaxID=106335 RepID=A0A6A3CDE5_HIBSY|nr:hypothetical protein F3Y22_tig00005465pilonHSYRG00097 [Hibiscus syriacus]
MGNCWNLLRPSEGCCLRGVERESKQKVVRAVRADGKTLEFKADDLLSFVADTRRAGGVKRIKVVITKQELQKLLSKQISVAEVITAGLDKRNGSSSPRCWKPKLESILELNE